MRNLATTTRAREARADARSDRIDKIAKQLLNGEIAPDVARVAIDAEKWLAGREMPKRYGDRVAVEASGSMEVIKLDNEATRRELARRLVYLLENLVNRQVEAPRPMMIEVNERPKTGP